MKKIHIAILIVVAAGIASLSLFVEDLTTYTTFTAAKASMQDKYVHIVATLDTATTRLQGNITDANSITFYAKDTTNNSTTKVLFNREKPDNFENSSRLVLKGYMRKDYFECKDIQLKCPSKYKDEANTASPTAQN